MTITELKQEIDKALAAGLDPDADVMANDSEEGTLLHVEECKINLLPRRTWGGAVLSTEPYFVLKS